MKDLKLSPDDPRLTAYALGELPVEERAAVEAALAKDPEARAFVEQTRAFAQQMQSAFAHEPELQEGAADAPVPWLEAEAAAKPEAASRGGKLPEYEATGPKFLRFPQLYFIVGGLAAAGFALMVALHDDTPRYVTKYVEVDLKPHGLQAPAMTPKAEAVAGAGANPAPAAVAAANEEMRRNASEIQLKQEANRIASTVDAGLLADAKSALPTPQTWRYAGDKRAATDGVTFSVPATAQDQRPLTLAPTMEPTLSVQLGIASAGSATVPEPATKDLAQRQPRPITVAAAGKVASPMPGDTSDATKVDQLASAPEEFGRQRDASVGAAGSAPAEGEIVTLSAFAVSAPANQRSTAANAKTGSLAGSGRAPVSSTLAGTRLAGTKVGIALPSDLLSAAVPRPDEKPSLSYAGSFVSAQTTPVASFWIPTDTGSYEAIRSAIDSGRLPTRDDVRIEELLNRFAWSGLSAAKDGDGPAPLITASLEAAEAPWAPTHRLVRIGVRAADLKAAMVANAKGGRVIAKDVKLELEFNPRRVAKYRLIGYEKPARAADRPTVTGASVGHLEAGQTVTALFEVVPVVTATEDASPYEGTYSVRHLVSEERARPPAQLFTLRVDYRNAASDVRGRITQPFIDNGAVFAAASDDFKFAAGVAAYGMILRDSPNRGKATIDQAIAWASAGLGRPGEDVGGMRGEFIDLMRRTKALVH